jgi:hypothetical protein
MYGVSDNPGLQQARDITPSHTTTPMLPGIGEMYLPGTQNELELGTPPMRVARLEPNREPAGIRFAANRDEMGERMADQVYIPLPAIPKTTAMSTRVRAGYPQFANDTLIPAVYVGGDALGGTNPQ